MSRRSLSGRLASITIGASVPGPTVMWPVTRMLLTALIFSRPPRAWMFFATISSTVGAGVCAADGPARARLAVRPSTRDRIMGGLLLAGRAYDGRERTPGTRIGTQIRIKEQPMKLNELLLGELEREAPASRRILERVPDGRYDWKPHEKSMPLGYLATLVATMPGWIDAMVNLDQLDFAPKEPSAYKPPELRTNRELLEAFDAALA